MRELLVGAVLLWSAACTEPRSERCKTVCEREAECAESSPGAGYRFEQQECVSACAALERDAEGKQYVARHVSCVDQAAGCAEIHACNLEYREADRPEGN